MRRVITVGYGALAYAAFLGSFAYAAGFVGNLWVPKSIDSGVSGPPLAAACVDAVLLGLFGVQHSLMARPFFKKWWTTIIPKQVERSTYVLLSSLLLILLYWQWRPLGATVWDATGSMGATVLRSFFWLGWLIGLASTFLINHFDLFGLRQVYLFLTGREYSHLPFKIVGLYRYVRHPLMLGLLISFWAAPVMTAGHLLFAVATTAYILVALRFEEHDLVVFFGDKYLRYKARVSMLLPLKAYRGE